MRQIPTRILDAHVHFLSYGFFSSLAQQKRCSVAELGVQLGWEMPDPDPVDLAARWVAELDRHGIARAALIASVPGDEGSVISAVRAFPDRFYGYFMCDPTGPEAPARVKDALASGLRGICLFPAMHRYSIHDERVLPLLEMAERTPGAVAFVHCGVLSVGVRKKLGLPSRFDMTFSNPIALHSAALQFPDLPFVVPHFGAGYLREALMLADLCPNVYFDTSSTNAWTRYHLPELTLREVFRRALEIAGPRRLLFGTDSSFFPRGWHRAIFDQQVDICHELAVAESDMADIFGGNMDRLLQANR